MSFWDRIRPTQLDPSPTRIALDERRGILETTWSDGVDMRISARNLRLACPCAECVDEWTGRPRLNPEGVPTSISVTDISPVGNYALMFTFSDGHALGIYPFKLLRAFARNTGPGEESHA